MPQEYRAWHEIKRRCFNKNCAAYKNYGGRGITLHGDWVDNYHAFLAHVGRKPSPEHSIDRIDNNKGYEPGNVRWATREEQNRNTRRNLKVYFGGYSFSLFEWSDLLNIPSKVLRRRITVDKWDIKKALLQPLETHSRTLEP